MGNVGDSVESKKSQLYFNFKGSNHRFGNLPDEELRMIIGWIAENSSGSTPSTATESVAIKPARTDESSGSGALAILGAVAGVYFENETAKANSRQRTTPQARTQTSQNNYPTDNTYKQDSNSGASAGNNADVSEGVNQCINAFRSHTGRPQFKNICNFRINIKWCVESECNSTNGGRLSWIGPGQEMPVMAEPEQNFSFAACRAPHNPGFIGNGKIGSDFNCTR